MKKIIVTLIAGLVFVITGNAQVSQIATLTLEGAQKVMDAAVAYAKTKQSPGGSIAVVDAGGHLLLFERLDGSFLTSVLEKLPTSAPQPFGWPLTSRTTFTAPRFLWTGVTLYPGFTENG